MTPPTPKRYRLYLIPDLVHFTFAGTVELRLESPSAIERLRLNILDLDILTCTVGLDDRQVQCECAAQPEKEELLILLPQKMQGVIDLTIGYQGQINDKMAGFYRSRYGGPGKTKTIAVTQFEESDARRAFPCMDHPARKATFEISMDIDRNLVAISNNAIAEETLLDNGKKRVSFQPTPKMSTYLVFFGVGEFEFAPDAKDPRVRVATLPKMEAYAKFALEFGRQSLAFSETYYGIAYPLPKLDLIAIPDFAFGAMENWGAITFRENLLLHYPQATSRAGEERICEVIAHEIAHQWFGNLVTPSDWKYLWLNESFATYFGYGVVDHYYPHWEVWQQFLSEQAAEAVARDALIENISIEIPGGEHVVINVSTAPIIYSKGGCILRQIEGYIGSNSFQKGLQYYLKTHQYANAASQDLWDSFEKVSKQPIVDLMKSWIEQPGLPLISVKKSGNKLQLTQKRFTYLPHDSDQIWQIPVTIRFFSKTAEIGRSVILMNGPELQAQIPEGMDAYKVNDLQKGFYITEYLDTENLTALGRLVRDKKMPPEDRWGLQHDIFSLLKSGKASLTDYLDFLRCYENEDAFLPLISISTNLHHAYVVMNDPNKEKISSCVKPWFERTLNNMGYLPAPEEKHTTALLRDRLLWHAAFSGSEEAMEFARRQFSGWIEGKALHPDIMKSVMQVAAFGGDDETFTWLDQRLQASEIEHERMNILTALGCFKESAQIRKSLRYTLERVPARNKFIPVVAMAYNPYAIPQLWDWYVSNLEQIEQFHPLIYERVVAAIIPVAGLEKMTGVKAFFEDYLQKNDNAKDVVKMSLERLEINLRIRESN
ncbi:M1 family metallopeptidase [Thermodesulfobacteriota bacterium]